MSGVFGIVDLQRKSAIADTLHQIGQRLTHREWYRAEKWASPAVPVGLGRSGIGIFNPEPQPIHSEDQTLTVVAVGEIYNDAALEKLLAERGLKPRSSVLPEQVLCAYRAFGLDFPKHLEGVFFAVVFDLTQRRVVLANDRFGLYPHYIWQRDGQLAFAPEVKGVLCAPFVTRTLDLTAVDQYVRFQQVVGRRTFHEGIQMFRYATVATFSLDDGTWQEFPYWDFDQIPDLHHVTFDEAVVEAGRLFRKAIEKRTSDALRPGVFLSGGMDGRLISGMMVQSGKKPVTAGFGREMSRDVQYGRRIAAALGTQHLWFDMPNADWVLQNIDLHLATTEGFHSWIHMHGANMLSDVRPLMDYNLTGWEGAIWGHPEQHLPPLIFPVSWEALAAENYHAYSNYFSWPCMREVDALNLYSEAMKPQMHGRAYDSLQADFARYKAFKLENAAEYFVWCEGCNRITINMNTLARTHIEVRFPMWDYAFTDFMFGMPVKNRHDRRLYRTVMTRELPHLARLPVDKDDYLATTEPWRYRSHKFLTKVSKRLKLRQDYFSLYFDYEEALKTQLRPWAEGILFDERTRARGLFNMEYVRTMMDRLLSGREYPMLGSVSHLITFELVMRELFD